MLTCPTGKRVDNLIQRSDIATKNNEIKIITNIHLKHETMKQKKSFLLVASVVVLAACSSNDLSESPTTAQQLDDSAVNFGAYVNRGATRAGAAGTLTTNGDAPAVSLQEVGFGVFAYYSDSESYSETSKPNFMYNQKVSGENWTYSPLKYWPNEFGKNASSEGQDRLTFFAYAPFVTVNPSTGRIVKGENDGDNGIVGMTSNTASGDPYIKYYADMDPDKRVDLCWGVAKENFIATVDEEAINEVAAGEPFIDVVKPATNSRIYFDFKHALAAVNVQIDTDVDVAGHDDNATAVDKYTRIWVRSVTFEGFTDKGRLNLNSRATEGEGPQWFDLTNDSPVASGTVSVYDGRTDGKEGRVNAIAKKESPATLNAKIIQSAPYDKTALENSTAPQLTIGADVPGVTNTVVNLFDTDNLIAPVYVIPTDDNLKVTIVYDVETYDPNLANFLSDGAVRGSSIQNTIEKEITFQPEQGDAITKLEAGKTYTINLHLGLTSVKFEASVTDWVESGITDVDLPKNTASVFDQTESNDYNTQHAIADAWLYGESRNYTEEEIAAHNAAIDVWAAPKAKVYGTVYSFVPYLTADPTTEFAAGLVKVMAVDLANNKTTVEVIKNPADAALVGHQYYVEAIDMTGGNDFPLFELDGTPAGISVKDVAKESDYSFDSFNSTTNVPYGSGTVKQISQEGGYTVVEVVTHSTFPEQIGRQYAVHGTSLAEVTEFELLTVDGHVPTGVKVKNLAAVTDAQAEVLYTDAEITAHNAEPAQQVWDATTEWNPTDDEVTAHNQTVPGAAYVGCAKDANGNPIPANNDPGNNDPGNNDPGNVNPSRPYFSSSSASNNYPVLAPWRR